MSGKGLTDNGSTREKNIIEVMVTYSESAQTKNRLKNAYEKSWFREFILSLRVLLEKSILIMIFFKFIVEYDSVFKDDLGSAFDHDFKHVLMEMCDVG